MKIFRIAMLFLMAATAFAQAATRPVVVTFTLPSGSSGVNLFACTVAPGGTSCTPSLTGTPVNSSPITSSPFSFNEPTGAAYGFTLLTLYPPCSSTSPITSPCGAGLPATVSFVPVPPQGVGATNVVVVVP